MLYPQDVSRERFEQWILLLFGMNLFDALITLWALERFHHFLAVEANPLMASLISAPLDFLAVKITVMTLACLIMLCRYQRFPKRTVATACVVTAIFTAVCAWNINLVIEARAVENIMTQQVVAK